MRVRVRVKDGQMKKQLQLLQKLLHGLFGINRRTEVKRLPTTGVGKKKAANAAAAKKMKKKEGDSDYDDDDDKSAARLEQEERKQRLKTLVASKNKGTSAAVGRKMSLSTSTTSAGLLRSIPSSKAFASSSLSGMAGFKRRTEIDRKLEMMVGPSGRLRPEYMEKKPIIDFLRLFNLCDISSDRPQQMQQQHNNNNNN